jgi:SNF2 family DNA or RNA helicase/HKD family nuclease
LVESVNYVDNFEKKAIDVIRDLAPQSDKIEIAVAFLSNRGWLEIKPSIMAMLERGGSLKVVVRRDPEQTNPIAVAQIFELPNVKMAFAAPKPDLHSKDYLFYIGKKLVVLTSSANATYGGLIGNDEGGAVITHSDFESDEAAKKVISIFRRRWESSTEIDESILEEYMKEAQTSDFRVGAFVRSKNRIYRSLGIGKIQKVRNNQSKVQFDPSVFSKPPYRSENKIMLLEELEMIDTPLDRMEKGEWDEPWKFEMKTMAARLLAANAGGQLSNARTELLPHQIFTAHKVVSSPVRRFLLADEVGLGKTIEAGMIWQALFQRGLARRTLIICPAGLTIQWQEEMQDKFGVYFEIFGKDFAAFNPRIWDLKSYTIASIDTLKREEHKKNLLENRKWDLIIFDEAHKLSAKDYDSGKTEKTQNYYLAEDLNEYCDSLLLLTATPHQGDENHSRFKNLIRLLDPNASFVDIPGCEDDFGTVPYYKYILRTPKKNVTDSEGRVIFKGRTTHRLPFVMYPDERKFYLDVENYIRDCYNMLGRIRDPKRRLAAGFVLSIFQKMNASSSYAIRSSLEKRKHNLLNPKNSESNINGEFQDERYEGELEEKEIDKSQQAIIENEVEEIDRLLRINVKKDKKIDELLGLIRQINVESPRGDKEKILIFTEYRKTQEYIIDHLEKEYGRGSVTVIHGGMKLENKTEEQEDIEILRSEYVKKGAMAAATAKRTSVRLFRERDDMRFMVSTEAGGEGINLQFCHIVVNYDSPWNPMRKEQRIGRVYRYGQDKVVQVYNYYNQGTIEEKVQTYSEDRIERAAVAISKVTGEDPEEIMSYLNGQLESEINPEKIYKRALVEGSLNNQTQMELFEAIERAKKAYDLATMSLFKDVSSYTFDKYQADLATELSLKNLMELTESFLKKHHRKVESKDDLLSFLAPDVLISDEIKERFTNVTFDRELAMKRSDLDFFAIGHPFINAMLSYLGSYDFSGLNSRRVIRNKDLAGTKGFQFNFIVKKRVTQELGDEYLFAFRSVFLDDIDNINLKALNASLEAESNLIEPHQEKLNIDSKLEKAKRYLEKDIDIWDWDEEVDLINIARVEFTFNGEIKKGVVHRNESDSILKKSGKPKQLKLSDILSG